MSLLGIGTAWAEPGDPAPVEVVTATGPIRIDGVLDEADWARATPVTDFLRYEPTKGGPPPGLTEVRFLQDDQTLYVGMRVTGADYDVRSRISEREDWRFELDGARRTLTKHFRVKTLEGFGVEDDAPLVPAAGALIEYLQETQRGACEHVRAMVRVETSEHDAKKAGGKD